MCVPFLSLIIILPMKSAWSKIINNYPSFFWLVLKRYDFIHLFTFNLYVFLYLKYISYRKPVVRYCFLMNSHNLCLFIVFKTCTVKIINIVGSISSILVFIFYPFYLFFIFSPLFFLPYLALLEQFYSLSLWFLGFSSLSIWITLLIKIISGFCKIYNTLLLLIYVHFQITLCHTMGIATTSQKSFPNSSFSFLLSLLSFISVTYSL